MKNTLGADLPDSIRQFLHDNMRGEYEIGVTDGMTTILRLFERVVPDYVKIDPAFEPGLKQAIELVKLALEDRPQETKDKGIHAVYTKANAAH